MRYIPTFIRQLAFDAIVAELNHVVPTQFPGVADLEATLVAVIKHAFRL